MGWMDCGSMGGERGQGLVEYALIVALVGLVIGGTLVAVGPSVGGVFSEIHYALQGMVGGDEVAVATATPTVTATVTPTLVATWTPTPTPTVPPLPPRKPLPTVGPLPPVPVPIEPPVLVTPTLPPTPTPTPTPTPRPTCVALQWKGTMLAYRHTLMLRWAYVTGAEPEGVQDPLVRGWTRVALDPIRLSEKARKERGVRKYEVEGNVVELVLSDLGGEELLRARVRFDVLEVRGSQGELVPGEELNFSVARVSNEHRSVVLAGLAESGAGTATIRLQGERGWESALRRGQAVYIAVTGEIRSAACGE